MGRTCGRRGQDKIPAEKGVQIQRAFQEKVKGRLYEEEVKGEKVLAREGRREGGKGSAPQRAPRKTTLWSRSSHITLRKHNGVFPLGFISQQRPWRGDGEEGTMAAWESAPGRQMVGGGTPPPGLRIRREGRGFWEYWVVVVPGTWRDL